MGATGVSRVVVSLLFLLGTASAARAQSGPVGYWKGDDGTSPTQAADSSGFNHNGTYQGGATTSTSVPTLQFPNPTSMSFTTAGALVAAPGFSWPSGGPVTITFWNYVTAAQVQNSSAFNVGNVDNPNRFHAHAPWGDGVLYWDYGDINSNGRVSASYTASLDKWTHVALVSAGVGGNFKAIYFDGVVAASGTTSSGPAIALTGVNIGGWPGASLSHMGMIDDFRIYNRVLSVPEIQALAAGNTEPATPTGLMALLGSNPGEIQLTWNASVAATSYILMKGTAQGGPYPTPIPVSGTSYLDTGLTNGSTYYYVVVAVGTMGQSAPSNEASATIPIPKRTVALGNDSQKCGCGSVPAPDGARLTWLALAALALMVPWRRR
jgi:MYXO-CTERM domain-containing protein